MSTSSEVRFTTTKGVTALGEGFAGYASRYFLVDLQGDMTVPGAFGTPDELAAMTRSLPVLWGHDLAEPVAIPTVLRDDDHGLWLEARWHSTARAREARAILKERQAAGVSPFGLSIGYRVRRKRFDPKVGATILEDIELLEVSLVSVPANPGARVTDVRAASQDEIAAMADRNQLELERMRRRLIDEEWRRFDAATRSIDEAARRHEAALAEARRREVALLAATTTQDDLRRMHEQVLADLRHYGGPR